MPSEVDVPNGDNTVLDGPIEHFSWGTFVVNGSEHSDNGLVQVGAGKDIRVIGLDVSEWVERKGHA
ncbi:MAG: hypothetical protein ACYC5M_08885 [Anaerolineae bacterium]